MIDQTAEALTHLANRAVEQGNETLARSLYEEGLAIWRVLDDAPCMAYALGRLRTLDGVAKPRPERFVGGRLHAASEGPEPSTKWAGCSSDTGTPAGSVATDIACFCGEAGHGSRSAREEGEARQPWITGTVPPRAPESGSRIYSGASRPG
jgi:hypothetical protein